MLIEQIRAGGELAEDQIGSAAEALLEEGVAAEEKVDFLAALAEKGETPREIAGFANAFLERAVDPGIVPPEMDRPLLDVCGTGGDRLDLFNVSTTSVFVLAGAGVGVVKHGNRKITSKSGGADVLEALGIPIDLTGPRLVECLKQVGAGFLFAPRYHPAFRAVAPVRKILAERGQRTVFNILGPLLNPARPDFQLIGVFDEALVPVMAEILTRLGRKRAWSVHGKTETGAGMDELSSLGPTVVSETRSGRISSSTIDPSALGLSPALVTDLRGGDAEENAAITRGILSGEIRGPKRELVLLNAGAGMVIAGSGATLEEGIALAGESIDSGAAWQVLERWRSFGGEKEP
jgi:anthranilate phosphoribosyltransferase